MTDTLMEPLAAPLACPDWCSEDRTDVAADKIRHIRRYPEDRRGRVVVITQADMPVNYDDDEPGWIREDATITIVATEGPTSFDVCGLTPEQGYALAALVGHCGNEGLASAILDAAILLKPEVER